MSSHYRLGIRWWVLIWIEEEAPAHKKGGFFLHNFASVRAEDLKFESSTLLIYPRR